MAIIGEKRQEAKLKEFAAIARRFYPDVNEWSIKGAFRIGVKAAMAQNGYDHWGQVVDQPADERRRFFNTMLEEARPYLKSVVGGDVDRFVYTIKVENEKYLKQG